MYALHAPLAWQAHIQALPVLIHQIVYVLCAKLALQALTCIPVVQLLLILFAQLALLVWLGVHTSHLLAPPRPMLYALPVLPAQLAAHTSHLLAPPQPILSVLPVQPVLLATMLVLFAHPL